MARNRFNPIIKPFGIRTICIGGGQNSPALKVYTIRIKVKNDNLFLSGLNNFHRTPSRDDGRYLTLSHETCNVDQHEQRVREIRVAMIKRKMRTIIERTINAAREARASNIPPSVSLNVVGLFNETLHHVRAAGGLDREEITNELRVN